jgi:hypothetical protein
MDKYLETGINNRAVALRLLHEEGRSARARFKAVLQREVVDTEVV